ncbi:MAG: acyl-ACP--UDP-N-acetylglucosamine O-acyltransferase [Bacteroidota bacterium]
MNTSRSVIHPDAKIGKNVTIEAFATIAGDVEIGDNCWIGPNVVIDDGARIGKNTRIFPGAVISTIPQDLKFSGEYTTVEIGDNCTIREFATVNRGTSDSYTTRVGNNVLIMAYAHIAHDCQILNDAVIANAVQLAGHVKIGEYAIIGGMSAIHQFTRIGRHAILQGGSLVGKDVPPYTKAARYPLRYMGVNSVGLRRRAYEEDHIREIQEIYRILFLSGLNTTRALERLEREHPVSPIRDEIIGFVRTSERGIMKGHYSRRDV